MFYSSDKDGGEAGVKHESLHVSTRTCLVLTGRKATPIRREDLSQHSISAVLTLGRTVFPSPFGS